MARRMPRHAVIDGFLPEDLHRRLLGHALGTQAQFEPTQVRADGAGRLNSQVRRSWAAKHGLGDLRAEFLAAITERFEGIREQIGVPAFPVEKCELELAAHRDGCFYLPHLDTQTGINGAGVRGVRALTMVYYFHRQPRGFRGGELALYPFSPEAPLLLEPADNRLLAFPSFARHEVRAISCPGDAWEDARFAINCWFWRPRGD